MLGLVVLLLAANVAVATPAILPASLNPSSVRPAEHAYICTVYVGAPPEELQLEVRFDVPGLWIYRDQSIHSAAHVVSFDGTESDVVYFGGVRQRSHTHRGSPAEFLTSPLLCGRCDGVLGMRADSELWQWFPDASFTPASVLLAGVAPPLRYDDGHLYTWELPCLDADAEINGVDGALCTVEGAWRGETYRVAIVPHSARVLAPRAVVRAYLDGKNIYDDGTDEWDPFELVLGASSVAAGGAPLKLALTRDDLSGQHGVEARELLIEPLDSSNTTIVIGSVLLQRYAMYRTASRGAIVLHAHPIFTHLPWLNALLFLVMAWCYVRWKVTELGRHYARTPPRLSVTVVDTIYQVVGWIIAIVALLLPATWRVMQDLPILHWTAAGVVGLGILVEVWARVCLARVQAAAVKARRPAAAAKPATFMLLFIESLWHEAVLATAMWILVAPRRREDLAGPLTAIVAGGSLYSCISHAMFLTIFGLAVKRRRRGGASAVLFATAILSVLGLTAYFGSLFVLVFALPTLTIAAAIYSELVGAVVIAIVGAIALGAVFVADAYVEKAVAISAKQHYDALIATDAPPKTTAVQFAQYWSPLGKAQ